MHLNSDLGKFSLRLSLAGLLILHGYHKLVHGFDGVIHLLTAKGLPAFFWIGVPFAEIIAPVFLLLGIFTRISSTLIVFMMLMTIYLAMGFSSFEFNQMGGLNGELNFLYLFAAIAILFIGPGKYRIATLTSKWLV